MPYGTVPDRLGIDRLPYRGEVGGELSVEDGYRSARLTALNPLAMAKAVLGDLDRVERVLQLRGFVNAAPRSMHAPRVLHGASDLLIDASARIAVRMPAQPCTNTNLPEMHRCGTATPCRTSGLRASGLTRHLTTSRTLLAWPRHFQVIRDARPS